MAGYNHLTGHIRPVFLFLALLVSSLSPRPGNAQVAALPVATLTIGHHKVNAEIAATDATREHGLMGRKALAPDHGMLFVFDQAAAQCFWMKNRSEEHTSELQSLMRISYAVFCLKKKNTQRYNSSNQ